MSDGELVLWDCDVHPGIMYLQGIIGGITSILCISSGIAFIVLRQESQHYGLKFVAWFATLAGSIIPFLFVAAYSIQLKCEDYEWYWEKEETVDNYKFIANFLYLCILCIVLHLFSFRLRKTFENTKYKLSLTLERATKVFVPVSSVCLFVLFIVTVSLVSEDECEDNDTCAILLAMVALNVLSFVVYGIVLLVVFLRQLRRLITDYNNSSKNNNNNDNDNNNNSGVSTEQTDELISLMSRYTILVCIAMFSTLLLIIIAMISLFDNLATDIFLSSAICIDSLVNGLCLILQFKIADKPYFVLCNCLHKQCVKKQASAINKQIESNKGKEKMLQDNNNDSAANVEMQSTSVLTI